MTNKSEQNRTFRDQFLSEPVTEYTTTSIEGVLVAQAKKSSEVNKKKRATKSTKTDVEMRTVLGWTRSDLVQWYQSEILNAGGQENRIKREVIYEDYTYALHVGLKLSEHWEFYGKGIMDMFVFNLSDNKGRKNLSELFAMLSEEADRFRYRNWNFPFIRNKLTASFSWEELSAKEKEHVTGYMKAYLNASASFFHPMSDYGKKILVNTYKNLKLSGKRYSDYRTEITRANDPPRFVRQKWPNVKIMYLYFLPEEFKLLVD